MNRFYECPDLADKYTQYRPCYTDEMARRVFRFCQNHQLQLHSNFKLDVMVDVGCGSGQSTNIFQPFFKEILGIDVSLEQLNQAKKQNKFENIRYLEGSAEKIPAKDNSVDLVLAATAAHWFDLPKFYKEVKRVLKPNTGCLAMFGYHHPSINLLANPNDVASQQSTQLIMNAVDICCTNISNHHVIKPAYESSITRYRDIFNTLPFTTKIRDDSFHVSFRSSLTNLCQFLSSTDAYHYYMHEIVSNLEESLQESTDDVLADMDPLYHLLNDLLALWKLKNDQSFEILFKIDFNPFVLLAC